MKKILIVVGARPNLVKASPLVRTLKRRNIPFKIVHTGQHYDDNMSGSFFRDLDIPEPNINLYTGRSSSEMKQVSKIIDRFEDVCIAEQPDVVIVIGDVNSTLACALVASRLKGIKLAHIESGERYFDLTMPEEMNRILTDRLSDIRFCSSVKALRYLRNEGFDLSNSHMVGNIVVEALMYFKSRIKRLPNRKKFILCTVHRQSNTDKKENLHNVIDFLNNVSNEMKIVFPMHPRTKKQIELFSLGSCLNQERIEIIDPLGYFDFITFLENARMIITDSGGAQMEAYVLETPCLTLTENTGWTETLVGGANTLIPSSSVSDMTSAFFKVFSNEVISFRKSYPEASKKIVEILMK
jgi:UDP-N-acetylglucosamine 2-epimerase